ncbi:glycine receptor subunit alpha-2-like [Neocloeon triangulifer]|uniref:glycine receptor subunit alpha-2-like n=1 Tax=Neocloeon triangulifer TaxID=2078957 RepID=UPI00286F9037|nr:glycine receptor subunit alpha-2-like [Neocloeon triangulifer]
MLRLLLVLLAAVVVASAQRYTNTTTAAPHVDDDDSLRWQNLSNLQILDALLKKYDRRATPTNNLGIPTEVQCDIYIRSFGSINPSTMDYQVDLYLQQTWVDSRLKNKHLTRAMDLNDPNLVQRIWKPEVFFANAKHAEFQYVTVPNVLIRVAPDGKILYMLRLKLTFSCMMDLYKFPLDDQICSMEIASFSKTTSELVLKWDETSPVRMYQGLKLPQFRIRSVKASHCKEEFHIGEYSCLVAEFHMQRAIGYHLVQSYLPSILVVVISWVSFWLDVEAIPARVTLGVTTLLTISSKASGIQAGLPQVSYVKAMDVWMGMCTTFVFSALLEFTLVNYLWRRGDSSPLLKQDSPPLGTKVVYQPQNDSANDKHSDNDACYSVTAAEESQQNSCGEERPLPKKSVKGKASKYMAKKIDQVCRVGFPFMFLVFNICYWLYYLAVCD